MHVELLRHAPVTIEARRDDQNHPYVKMLVADKYEHTFSPDSRVSKALDEMTPEDLEHRLSGGYYFFVDKKLVDFRYGMYNGFVHTDESLAQMIRVLGVTPIKEFGGTAKMLKGNTVTGEYVLGRTWSDNGFVVPGYKTGGDFNSRLIFMWNPFVKTVNSYFQLVRLICENGMVGLANFLNTKIPLMNRWEEHLNIANRQIQNKINGVAIRRLEAMGRERATVEEVILIADHAQRRVKAINDESNVQTDKLRRIHRISNPINHLAGVYRENVFSDKRLAAQLPAHLTTFDVYNLATEIRTHSTECDESTDLALDRFSNKILFDRKNLTGHVGRFSDPIVSSFSDPDAAFFGQLH